MIILRSKDQVDDAAKLYDFVCELLLKRLPSEELISTFVIDDGQPLCDFLCSLRAMHKLLSLLESALQLLFKGKREKESVSSSCLNIAYDA